MALSPAGPCFCCRGWTRLYSGCEIHEFADGDATSNLITGVTTYADDRPASTRALDSHVRLVDVRGAEYTFGPNQYFSDTAQIDGSLEAVARYTFRLISNGGATRDFVRVEGTVQWHVTTRTYTTSFLVSCVGGPG